jgi:hypothetical protein
MVGQCSGERFEVVHVAGQDRFGAAYGYHDEVGVDDVARPRACQQVSDLGSVIEGDNDQRVKKSREACLSSAIAPHLRDDGVRRGQRCPVDERGGEELLCSAFTSVDRDEEPGVKNQGGSGRSWPSPLVRRPGLPRAPSLRGDRRGRRAVGFLRRGGEALREVRSIDRHGSRPTRRACALRRDRVERWSSPYRECSTNVLHVVCESAGASAAQPIQADQQSSVAAATRQFSPRRGHTGSMPPASTAVVASRSAVGVKDGYRLDVTPLGFYSVLHQREEVVQHMPDNSYGTLEVVGR